MKKLILFFILITTACNDNLDIEPQQAISTEVALSTEQGVKTALIGIYNLWASTSLFSGDVLINSELLIDSDNLFWAGIFSDLTLLLEKRMGPSDNNIAFSWIRSYQIINQTNSILSALEVVNETERDKVAAEARFLRAMTYFDLVNLYARTWGDGNPSNNLGVSIITTPSEENLLNPIVPRNTVAEVYALVAEDLQFAKANLAKENGVFATTYAASAVLSRVFLMQEKYDLAGMEADRILKEGGYELLSDLMAVFNASNNTSEDIFSIQITTRDNVHTVPYLYSGELEGGGGFIGITDEHIAKYEEGDKRKTLFYLDEQSDSRRTAKWRPNVSNDGNITLIRLAEMYLTRAETRFRTGDISGATEDINNIRNRAGLPDLIESELTLDHILKERFLELVFEGHQYRDVKRNRQSVRDLAFNDARLIYPIPQRELEVNSALVQNEGY